MKSSIIKCAISVIQIKPKHLWNVSQNNKHDGNQMPKNVDLAGWLQKGSTEGSWQGNEHVIISVRIP